MKVCPLCSSVYEGEKFCPQDGATLIPKQSLDDALIGKVLKDAYRIEEQIGAGGMGAVYRVTQIRLGRSVAVKILLPKFHSTAEMVQRFFREAQLLSRLNHPNIVSIYDFGNTEDGLIYMVMEFLEGKTLSEYVPIRKGLPLKEIAEIMRQVGHGLAAAHQVPVIHRDLKPGNIFIANVTGKETLVKVLDFGISKVLEDENQDAITKTGVVMGTPGFMAPEQITGTSEPGIPADIYAFGGILYFLMGGKKPFSEATERSALIRQLQEDPSPIDSSRFMEPNVAKLFPIVEKAMKREPSDRYQSVEEMMADLRRAAGEAWQSNEFQTVKLSTREEQVVAEDAAFMETEVLQGESIPKRREADTPRDNPSPSAPSRKSRSGVFAAIILLLLLGAGFYGYQAGWFKPKEPLKLGMSADFSGGSRELGREMQVGIQTAILEINESGGIDGRELQLIALDDHYEPEPAAANTRRLIEQEQVFALIGNVGTPTAQAALPVALERKTIFFGPFTGAGFLRKDPPDRYVFNYRASYAEETAAMVTHFIEVLEIDPKAIAVFSQNDSFGDSGFQGVVRTLRAQGVREEEILHVRYERNKLQVDDAVKTVLAAPNPVQAIVLVATYKQSARFISALKNEERQPVFSCVSFVGAGALSEEFHEMDPKLGEGVIITQVVPYFRSGSTGVMHYRDQLQNYFPNEHPSFVSLEGYISARIFLEALQRAEKLETETVVDTLEAMKDFDLGMGSTIDFSPSDHQASEKVWAVVLDENSEIKEYPLR